MAGTFCVGAALWGCGLFVVFDLGEFWAPVALMYLVAAVSQLLAGLAVLRLNARVKAFFATPEGVRSLQMQDVVTNGQDAGPVALHRLGSGHQSPPLLLGDPRPPELAHVVVEAMGQSNHYGNP